MILGLDEWHFREISQFMRLWYLSHMRAAKAQTSLFVFVFVALRPMSTAMVIAGRSVYLTTLFPGQA